MTFENQLENYLSLVVKRGLNIQPGQEVLITAEAANRQLALRFADACYREGAGGVTMEYLDPQAVRLVVLHAKPEFLSALPEDLRVRYDGLIDRKGARLYLDGLEDPDALKGLDPGRVNAQQSARYQALRRYFQEGINKELIQWCVVGVATAGWAQKVFPQIADSEKAVGRLWSEIFASCRADNKDPISAWDEHDQRLHRRAEKLTELKLSALHFSGPGTDLTVGLTEKAIFKGGSEFTASNVRFNPNLPTEEVFTTPDWRRTEGKVRATRPVMINGVLIEGLEMTFQSGVLVDFRAASGAESFQKYVDRDSGGRQLGEVALVGIDSPIYRSGLIFGETLYDENACCHIAFGSAYTSCLENGPRLSSEELAALGCNDSAVHSDVMISSEETDVTGENYEGKQISVIRKGVWVLGS